MKKATGNDMIKQTNMQVYWHLFAQIIQGIAKRIELSIQWACFHSILKGKSQPNFININII